jgi:hypothetical protein
MNGVCAGLFKKLRMIYWPFDGAMTPQAISEVQRDQKACHRLLLSVFSSTVRGCEGDLPQGAIARVGDALVSQDEFEQLKQHTRLAGSAPDEDTQQD